MLPDSRTSPYAAPASPAATAVGTNGKRIRGVVKWFNDEKGFGFISPADSLRDVFVHYSGIRGYLDAVAQKLIEFKGRKSLQQDQEVEFEVVVGEKGPYADKVDVIHSPTAQ